MADITAPGFRFFGRRSGFTPRIDEAELERVRGERLRSVVPVTISMLALLGVLVGVALMLHAVIDVGTYLLQG